MPLELLDRLGLVDQVSPYSYLRGRLAHLEEDCDYSLFARAMNDRGLFFTVKHHHADKRSKIRGYASYHPEHARKILAHLRETAV